MIRYNIEELQKHLDAIAQFNRLDLSTLELHEGGKPLPVTPEIIADFKFTGLNNKDFIECRWWDAAEEKADVCAMVREANR